MNIEITTKNDLFAAFKSLNVAVPSDEQIIRAEFPEYTIYLNYNKVDVLSDTAAINDSLYHKYKNVFIVEDSKYYSTAIVELVKDKEFKTLSALQVFIEVHAAANIFYLKIILDSHTQQEYYKYVDSLHKAQFSKDKLDETCLSEEDFNKVAMLVRLPSVHVMEFSRVSYIPEENPPTTTIIDIPTIIKYSNILIDDFISSKGLKQKSKYK